MHDNHDQILNQLRDSDRSLYVASLLMPEEIRWPITTIYAFHAEIGRIRQLVKEPLPGEIRLQWWREVTADNARKDEAAANPLSAMMNKTIDTYDLPRGNFENYCRARIFDLYDDPMPDILTYEGYAGEVYSTLFQMCCHIIDQDRAQITSTASGHAGVAFCVAQHLARLSVHARNGQIYIPMVFLKEHGLTREDFLNLGDAAKISNALADFIAFGRNHLDLARQAAKEIPDVMMPAYVAMASCERIFNRAAKMESKCLSEPAIPAIWLQQWDLWRTRKKGMF